MKEIPVRNRVTLWLGCIVVVLCASAVLARDPSGTSERSRTRTQNDRLERLMHREVALARAILREGKEPLEVRRRAEMIVRNWDKDVLDPEPVLLEAFLAAREFSESSGELFLIGLDEDDDPLGLRIREKYLLANGVTSVPEEDYPVYARYKDVRLSLQSLAVRYRTGLQVKDQQQWQSYLEQIQRADTSAGELKQPPVWISVPEPNRIEVFVSVYDRTGHASEWIPVEGPSRMAEIPDRETVALAEYHRHGT